MSPEQRSRCMSRIKGKDTSPELHLRKALWAKGYRYRLISALPGRPDIIFPRQKLAVFVDGCFWHGCPDHAVSPKSNQEFWFKKIKGNMERDARVNASLAAEGWRVIRIWEHEIAADIDSVILRIGAIIIKA